MKKIVSVICLAIISFLLFPALVSADEVKENLPLKACSTGVLGKHLSSLFKAEPEAVKISGFLH